MTMTSSARSRMPLDEARASVARVCSPLPPGPAEDQLRNFCGRAWEVMHTPTFASVFGSWVHATTLDPGPSRASADELLGPIHDMLAGIIERGMAEGRFRPVTPRAAARLITSALLMQAFWCNHAAVFGPPLGGGCHRVAADTLSVLLGGLRSSRPDATS